MENLMIQYAPHVSAVDFAPFLESEDCGIKISRLIEGAKGNEIIHKNVNRNECRDYVEKMAMEYAGKFLKEWNGWTWRWYVDEFMKRVGL